MDPPNQSAFWKEFFNEYSYYNISSGVGRSIALKWLCNEVKLGSFNRPGPIKSTSKMKVAINAYFGGLLSGKLNEDREINDC